MGTLEGQTALVTGATRGIGAGIAAWLQAEGATVVGTATSEGGAEQLTSKLGTPGQVLDAGSADSVQSLLKSLNDAALTPSILVNNAGITRDTLLLRMKDHDWHAVMQANLYGAFALTRGCVRGMMKARHGRIINLTSIVGFMGNAGQANYAVTKAGIVGFTKSVAREFAPRGITVNAVAPGFIDTDMTRDLSEAQREALSDQIPTGRLGAVADIAAAVGFLAGPDAAYITGQTLHVNGGMLMS